MPENRGNAVGYASARTHVPLPVVDDKSYRAAHQPQESRDRSTFDWEWNKEACTTCTAKVPKSHLVDGVCRTCRGDLPNTPAQPTAQPTAQSRSGHTYQTFTDTDIEQRYQPRERPTLQPVQQLPPHDGTRLGRDLAELEATDPDVAAAAASLDDAIARITRPEDHVKPERLDLVAMASEHATRVLTRSYKSTDPLVGLLRTSALASLEALDLYLELHATPAPPPVTSQPDLDGLGGDRPADGSRREGEQQPARFQTPDRPPPLARPRRSPAPRGDVDEAAMVREYVEDQATAPDIAKRHGCTPARVRRILERSQVQLRDDRTRHSGGRNKITYTPEAIADVVRRYVDEQHTLDQIETDTGIERRQARQILTGAGVTIRPSASAAHTEPSDDAKAQMLEQYLTGGSLAKVAAAFHVRQETVRAVVTDAGHPIRVKGSSAGNAQRLRDLGLTAAQVKDWAMATGLVEVRPAGLVGRALMDAYVTAHSSDQEAS